MNPARGEVWLIDFGEPVGREQAGRRPALVVSADALNEGASGVVIVVPLTTARRELPSHIEIDADASGIGETSYAKCEDVKSISTQRLISQIGRAGPDVLFDIGRVLRFLLDL